MNGRYLLDTNIVIALLAGEPGVLQHLDRASEVFLPCIVLGELYYGALKSARVSENTARIDELAEMSSVMECDRMTAWYYGEIKSALHARGRPIPENDIWIAAVARQHKLSLVSRDRHFAEVDQLVVEAW